MSSDVDRNSLAEVAAYYFSITDNPRARLVGNFLLAVHYYDQGHSDGLVSLSKQLEDEDSGMATAVLELANWIVDDGE